MVVVVFVYRNEAIVVIVVFIYLVNEAVILEVNKAITIISEANEVVVF